MKEHLPCNVNAAKKLVPESDYTKKLCANPIQKQGFPHQPPRLEGPNGASMNHVRLLLFKVKFPFKRFYYNGLQFVQNQIKFNVNVPAAEK